MNNDGEILCLLTSEQVRVGTNVLMSHAERQAFWKNSEVGKLLGFDRWPDNSAKENNKRSN